MTDRRRFEAEALVHLDAAYNLARWLLRAPAEADDAVQEAMLRAFRGYDGRRGAEVRPWLLAIVRNCCYDAAGRRAREAGRRAPGDPALVAGNLAAPEADEPLAAALRAEAAGALDQALAALAPDFREVLVLREIEDLSYREIAEVIGAPVGTVMSRLARARAALRAVAAGAGGQDDGLR
ncbi:MAG TPA: sigma-70 family RNA polymerase sigma factor [Steroidobacteraceae bacterium]|nr:sigma-70 family RNA polymerase sigma factor [Steroidobacteraceae bacterium]